MADDTNAHRLESERGVTSAVAGVTSTLSKHPALFPENAPRRLVKARGSQVVADDGRAFIDWIAGLLAVTLGHRHPDVTDAVIEHLYDEGGPTWSLAHPLEEEVAGTLRRLAGYPDGQVRFVKTGSEACAAAVRIARAVTGRAALVSAGYHGWHDAVLTTPPAWGTTSCASTDVEALAYGALPDRFRPSEVAAVIVEPVTLAPPQPDWLRWLRSYCDDAGALLIFDECITGARYPEFTAGRHYGVHPDLTVLSKGLANGWPLGCVVGSAEVMLCCDVDWQPAGYDGHGLSGPVYVSGTYSGETASLAAAKASLAVWERDGVAAQLHERGEYLRAGLLAALSAAGETRVSVRGPAYRLAVEARPAVRTALLARLLDQGHLLGTGCNLMAAHSQDDCDSLIEAFAWALRYLDDPAYPAGRTVAQPYRQG